ncbi:MAG: TonB-dependent receptor [Halieaceae bacterium]|jgi:iron complex outermembrane recepter protein|nr:TonB-dependent receptor [Halieaceae bacterium]
MTNSYSKKPATRRFAAAPLAAAVVHAMLAQAAVAQDERAILEEVIVTATKRELNLQDVGQSIVAFSTADIEKMGIKSMSDYIRALPSVSLTSTTPGRNSLVMRGISTGSSEYRTDSQTALYLDEQPMTTNSQQVSVRAIDMERIEALPGPQGTLFGSSSQTGTLRMITNKPNHDGFSGQVEGSYGSTTGGDNSYDINGHLNIPLIDDILSMRLVGYTSEDGGYVDNVYGRSLSGNFDNADEVDRDFNTYGVDGGRISVLWTMNEDWSALFSVVGERTDTQGSWETDPELGDHKITRFVDEWREDDWYSAAVTLTGDLGFASLSGTVTHFERDIAYEWDNNTYAQQKDRYYGGGLYWEAYYAGDPYYYNFYNYGLYDSEYLGSSIINDQKQERDTLEIRLASQGDSRLQWMVGAFYEDVYDEWYYYTKQPGLMSTRAWATAQNYAYYNSNYYDNVTYPLPDTEIGYSNTMERSVEQIAVFGELSYDLTEKWEVTGGVRWAEFERDEYDKYQFPEGLAPFGGADTDGSYGEKTKNDDMIYKFSTRYHFDDDRMVYFLFSQGFRLGGANSDRAANTGVVPKNYEPDFLDNYEVGIKSQWLDNSLQLNASLFFMEWDDYQVSAWDGVGPWWLRGTLNAKTAESKGIEADVNWQATDRLSFRASIFVAEPQFTEEFVTPGGSVYRDGMPMPGAPEEKAFFSVSYDIPDVLGGDLWFYYDITYESESWNGTTDIIDRDENGLSPSWHYSNFQMGLDLPSDLSMVLSVDNVFDQETYSYVSTSGNDDADLFGDNRYHNLRSLDRPRTVWFTLRKDF